MTCVRVSLVNRFNNTLSSYVSSGRLLTDFVREVLVKACDQQLVCRDDKGDLISATNVVHDLAQGAWSRCNPVCQECELTSLGAQFSPPNLVPVRACVTIHNCLVDLAVLKHQPVRSHNAWLSSTSPLSSWSVLSG